jgi:hypothetical protein
VQWSTEAHRYLQGIGAAQYFKSHSIRAISDCQTVVLLAVMSSHGWRNLLMDDDARAFNGLRPRLQKIAYRMLGSVAEAEDIVQDVWLRWHAAPARPSKMWKRGSSQLRRACGSTVFVRQKFNANTTRVCGYRNLK